MLRTEHGAVVMTAFRDLHPGDELTFDYSTSEDHEQNWKCLCGAPTCRGRVTGDDWRDPSFQAKYRGHCMPHVEHLIATVAPASTTTMSIVARVMPWPKSAQIS